MGCFIPLNSEQLWLCQPLSNRLSLSKFPNAASSRPQAACAGLNHGCGIPQTLCAVLTLIPNCRLISSNTWNFHRITLHVTLCMEKKGNIEDGIVLVDRKIWLLDCERKKNWILTKSVICQNFQIKKKVIPHFWLTDFVFYRVREAPDLPMTNP